jgi:radical SAM protein with 4Fe4S-binding SPASM domain
MYEKGNSLVEIHHRNSQTDVLPRFQKVLSNLSSSNLSSYKKSIIRDAIGEILGEVTPEKGFPIFSLHSYNLEEISKLDDQSIPNYLFYRYRYDTFPKKLKLDSFPPCLQIEPTSICNYRCLFCYQIDEEFTNKNNGMMGMMSLEVFKRIIDECENEIEAVTLASRGEPLICPDIEEMLKYVSGKFLALKLNTNAWFLDENKSHIILDSGINNIVFSADAASEPTYSRLRVNGKLDRVYKNIKRFHEIRNKYYPNSKIITRISGVQFPGADSLVDMKKFWSDFVDQVAFVKYNPWENTYCQPVNNISDPCSDLWRRMFIWWDGKVNPCDIDFKSHLCIGNITQSSLSDLWRSSKYSELRESHRSENRAKCSPCNQCSFI